MTKTITEEQAKIKKELIELLLKDFKLSEELKNDLIGELDFLNEIIAMSKRKY